MLRDLGSSSDGVQEILRTAQHTWGEACGLPRGVIILVASMPAIAAKYENIAYRLLLLNAGIIFNSIYMIAAAANIGVCALGTGDSKSFARISGLDEAAHFAIAEMAVAGLKR